MTDDTDHIKHSEFESCDDNINNGHHVILFIKRSIPTKPITFNICYGVYSLWISETKQVEFMHIQFIYFTYECVCLAILIML